MCLPPSKIHRKQNEMVGNVFRKIGSSGYTHMKNFDFQCGHGAYTEPKKLYNEGPPEVGGIIPLSYYPASGELGTLVHEKLYYLRIHCWIPPESLSYFPSFLQCSESPKHKSRNYNP